jgi:hypothetical protein
MSLQPGPGWVSGDGGAGHHGGVGHAVPDWLAALRRSDRITFDKTVRHTQERVAGHLLGALRLPPEQAVDLTGETVRDALRTAGQGAAIESPLARLYGAARAGLPERLYATFGDIPGLNEPFDPEPPRSVLLAYQSSDPAVERALAHRRDLPPFLELLHGAMASLPADQRATVDSGWTPPLLAVAGALLLAHGRPDACRGLDAQLVRVGWQPGHPLDPAARTGVLAHVGGCDRCLPSYQRAVSRLGELPPLLLWVTLRLAEQRQHLADAIFADPAALPAVPALHALPAGGRFDGSDGAGPPGGQRGPGGPDSGETDRRRRYVAAAAVLLVVSGGLVAWRMLPSSEPATQLAQPVASGGPAADPLDPALTGGGPADSAPAPATAPARTTPPASPSTAPSTTAASSPAAPTTTAPARTPASHPAPPVRPAPTSAHPTGGPSRATPSPTPTRPVGQLVVRLARRSTGGLAVTIAGTAAGLCTDTRSGCAFTFRAGDRVTIRPVDFALNWSGPCRGTSPTDSCGFVANGSVEVDAWVFRTGR